MIARARRILHLLRLLLTGSWRTPTHAEVLLLFADGADVLASVLDAGTLAILDPREHSVNTRIALHCLIRGRPSTVDYVVEYVQRVRPRVLLTFLDNYWQFYEIKDHLPEVRIIAVQNGVRGASGDVFGVAETIGPSRVAAWHVDDLCVFGPAVGREYARYVRGRQHVIGSVKNNAVPRTAGAGPLLGYISTWRAGVSPDQLVAIHGSSRRITMRQVYARRDQLVRFLDEYARGLGSQLLLIGKDSAPNDLKHYRSVLGHEDFAYSPREDWGASYRAVDRHNLLVFSSSTLGYEALGRGKRTAAFFVDIELTGAISERFGWPLNLPDDGPFWTHHYDESRFHDILDHLRTMSDAQWHSCSDDVVRELIVFDERNHSLAALLRSDRSNPSTLP